MVEGIRTVEIARPARQVVGRDPGTPGGARLRALREQVGRTQLWVELEAELGTGYLQRLESGRVAQPERPTLERILTALEARYSERRDVMGLFGYTTPASPPTEQEIAWACAVSRRELDQFSFPAYVLDCAHHLIAWNRYVPRLLGPESDDPLIETLAGRSLLAAWFDLASPLARLVVEPDSFLPALIRALRYEMEQLGSEAWHQQLLRQLLNELPSFRRYWAAVEQEPAPLGATRALAPMRLHVPGAGLLQFRLSAEHFTRDARFRVVYYFPADLATMQQCEAWRRAAPRA